MTLAGGPDAVFVTDCKTPSGTASSTLITQNGDRTVTDMAPLSLSDCSAGSGGGGSGRSAARPAPPQSSGGARRARPRQAQAPSRLSAGADGAKLRAFTIALPRGLRFVGHRHRGKLSIRGMRLGGAKAKTIALNAGRLAITLRKAVSRRDIRRGSTGV